MSRFSLHRSALAVAAALTALMSPGLSSAWSPNSHIDRLRVWGGQAIVWLDGGYADSCPKGSYIIFKGAGLEHILSTLLSAKLADRPVSILASPDTSGQCIGRSVDFDHG